MTNKGDAGGAAMSGGAEFQARASAWLMVHVLAEDSASLPFNLPAHSVLTYVACEAAEIVNDIRARIGIGTIEGEVNIQAKRGLSLSAKSGSEFDKAIAQLVSEYCTRLASNSNVTQQRPLIASRDRLVILTTADASDSIRRALPEAIRKLRSLPVGSAVTADSLNTANASQNENAEILLSTMLRHWSPPTPTDGNLNDFLSLLEICAIDVDGGSEERRCLDQLRNVLKHKSDAQKAWSELIAFAFDLMSNRRGASLKEIVQRLQLAGLELTARFPVKVPPPDAPKPLPRSMQDGIRPFDPDSVFHPQGGSLATRLSRQWPPRGTPGRPNRTLMLEPSWPERRLGVESIHIAARAVMVRFNLQTFPAPSLDALSSVATSDGLMWTAPDSSWMFGLGFDGSFVYRETLRETPTRGWPWNGAVIGGCATLELMVHAYRIFIAMLPNTKLGGLAVLSLRLEGMKGRQLVCEDVNNSPAAGIASPKCGKDELELGVNVAAHTSPEQFLDYLGVFSKQLSFMFNRPEVSADVLACTITRTAFAA